eukprot:TRINITY_DN20553_c0_g1_i1.p1 TRINITY_DN20553_c0_g1~~TRINITY_DN20553_c0_g1_i1.p1  ORF type:complete len:104 (-),score=6.01 TRINITY_DN20553_c0_g1_i1:38-349(-)
MLQTKPPSPRDSDSSESEDDINQILNVIADSSPSEFSLQCPYTGCGSALEAKDFVSHVKTTHATDTNQKYVCTLCSMLSGGSSYAVNDSTNLYNHITNAHSDW